MIMTGDSQSVTQAQFLTAAKECLEAEKRVRSRDPEVLDVLQRMQEHLKYNTQQAYSTFVACDGGRGGHLEPYELLLFCKKVQPRLNSQQLRYLIFHIAE